MPVVPLRMIRALAHCSANDQELARPDATLACWNWALAGDFAPAGDIDVLYSYANSGDNFTGNAGPTLPELRARREGGVLGQLNLAGPPAFPGLVANGFLEGRLTAVRTAWLAVKANAYDNAKKRQIGDLNQRLTTIIAGLYGLPTSINETNIEIGMHADIDPRRKNKTIWVPGLRPDGRMGQVPNGSRPETDPEWNARRAELGLAFEHWWIRFKGGPIDIADTVDGPVVETWVNRASMRWASRGQRHEERGVWRANVSELTARHIVILTALIAGRKGTAPFVHPLVRQAWVGDATRRTCTWCDQDFTFTRRRHHCRACGHLFCADCSPRTEHVALPASENNAAAASVVRVCDTCYSGNL